MPYSSEEKLAIDNLNFLLKHAHLSNKFLKFSSENKLSANWIFKTKSSAKLANYLQALIDDVTKDLSAAPEDRKYSPFLAILLQKVIHLDSCKLINRLYIPELLKRKNLRFEKFELSSSANTMHNHQNLVPITYDKTTGLYTSPDDEMAHKHGQEAKHIFLGTQTERFKSLIHRVFSKIGIYVFENTTYQEHDYLDTDIYANDLAVDPYQQTEASHFFDGHATNLITIPADTTPLHILTDPVEGHLNPLLYPRMTKVANKITNTDETMLPKVDVVVISHNHRDHVDINTLKKLVDQQPLMIIPEGDRALFKSLGFENIVDLKWWEQTSITHNHHEVLRITAVPTKHWSGRGLCDAHKSAFNGYVFEAPTLKGDIYFAGDTALMEEQTSAPIFEAFNIHTSIQPGGPDEIREQMESTHQSSADAILMHFKILFAAYTKQLAVNQPEIRAFLDECKAIKTIYNHTATFKLGNLRLRDTFYSVNRIIAAFAEEEQWRQHNLTPYEYEVFNGIHTLTHKMEFAEGKLTANDIAEIITHSVIVPKIGERITLNSVSTQEINSRNLILNKRALIQLDKLTQSLLTVKQQAPYFNIVTFVVNALEDYNKPWHAFFSRTHRDFLAPLINKLKSDSVFDIADFVREMEKRMQPLNRFGHMQSLINYTKWLLEVNQTSNPRQTLDNFFTCQQVRQRIDQEMHSAGTCSLLSDSRKPKQKAFKKLANKLARAPLDPQVYNETITHWQKNMPTKGGQNLINQHRLFSSSKKTHSQDVIEQTIAVLGR